MTVAKRLINGESVWVIDRRFRRADGKTERYRRAAQVRIKAAALQEEMDLCTVFKERGTIAHLLQPAIVIIEPKVEPAKVYYWADAVAHYSQHELPRLKPSAQRSWRERIDGPHQLKWKGMRLTDITLYEMKAWDAAMCKVLPNPGSRRNQHLTLRSTLRSVGPQGDHGEVAGVMLAALPLFPKLPKVPKNTVPKVPADTDVELIMFEGRPGGVPMMRCTHALAVKRAQLAYGLSIWAGLRACEVRALRKSDIDMTRRRIMVRRSKCVGVETTTKGNKERSLPINDLLWERLEERLSEIKGDDYIAVNGSGEPWGDYGIWQAFVRACRRLCIMDSRFHACRHYFATSLFGHGATARSVMEALGHEDLVTTLRYSHFQTEDLDRAVAKFSRRPLAAE